ncbi:MAG: AraC family transcriptional regulator [Niastella sp. SCN 39-18]|nr:helix-turn-helix transcriptional regulator [Sphingobacteriales bacterium]ODT51435.1 MAG: AraC family transcriptional regulator [Niastella sp. SCN 39-18]OJW08195.1 MAG: AraC family transcriptional regulator [Sphingobacteriales bacterium 39-19]
MNLFIKNMVCNRCIMVVKQELEALGLQPLHVTMGEAELKKQPTAKQMQQLNSRLLQLGFEILDDQKQKQIEKIKSLLIKKVQSGQVEEHFSITAFLGNALHKDYSYISRLFSEVEGTTVEQYFILQKIEKVKELLVYGEENLSEISYRLGYSSVAHLSAQFKKITGFTPSQFKKLGGAQRKPLDAL